MWYYEKKVKRISISKVTKLINKRLHILFDNAFEVDNDYLKLYNKQYRIFVYPYIRSFGNHKIRIVISYEYFLTDDFSLKYQLLHDEKNNDSYYQNLKGLIDFFNYRYNMIVNNMEVDTISALVKYQNDNQFNRDLILNEQEYIGIPNSSYEIKNTYDKINLAFDLLTPDIRNLENLWSIFVYI